MEILNVVVAEILLCLALAWVLGFLAAWILFRKVQNEYEQEIEELEENLSYASAFNKNQEREIATQSLKLQEFEKLLKEDIKSMSKRKSTKKVNTEKESIKKESIEKISTEKGKSQNSTKKENSNDADMLKLIDDNLYTPKKK